MDFSLGIVNFLPSLNMHFEDTLVDRLLISLSIKTRLFVKNVLYYYFMAKQKLKKIANNSLAKSLEKRKAKKPFEFKKVFNFDSLVKKLHELIESFPDPRTGKNISKSMKDAALGAFSIFFTQSPSFLSYQKSMQETEGQNNAATLFGINDILSDNHIRKLLDEVDPSYIFPLFTFIFDALNDCGCLDEFRSLGYHLEHNFGHGKKNLAALLMTFNLLAFLFHTVLGFMDEKYKLIRKTLPTRKTFFQDIRALTRYICFDSWNQLMIFMLRGLKLKIPIEIEPEPEVIDTS